MTLRFNFLHTKPPKNWPDTAPKTATDPANKSQYIAYLDTLMQASMLPYKFTEGKSVSLPVAYYKKSLAKIIIYIPRFRLQYSD